MSGNERGANEGLRGLMAKWREGAGDSRCDMPFREAMEQCADELEAALAQGGERPAGPLGVCELDSERHEKHPDCEFWRAVPPKSIDPCPSSDDWEDEPPATPQPREKSS